MSLESMNIVLNYELTPREKYVLLLYANYANAEGKGVWPSDATMSRKTGYSRKTIFVVKTILARSGLIVRVGTHPNKSKEWFTVEWEINHDWQGTLKEVKAIAQDENDRVKIKQGVTTGLQPDAEGVTTGLQGGVTTGLQGGVTTGLHDPSVDPPVDPPALEDQPQARKKSDKQIALKILEEGFSAKTLLALPKRDTKAQCKAASAQWWSPLSSLWEACHNDTTRAIRIMNLAYDKALLSRLTVSSPKSIEKIAIGLIAHEDQQKVKPIAPAAGVAVRTVYSGGLVRQVAA